MVPGLPRPAARTVGAVLLTVAATLLLAGSVNSLPGFSDHTGPTELTVSSFERAGTGCVEDPDWPDGGSASDAGPGYVRTSGIVTADADADLSVWVERTSPAGADLSTFRVHVESHHERSVEADCENGSVVGYRLELDASGGSPAGFFPDDHGSRVLYFENGELSGCSAGYTGGLDGSCDPFFEEPRRTWANATDPTRRVRTVVSTYGVGTHTDEGSTPAIERNAIRNDVTTMLAAGGPRWVSAWA